jgi:hypothetical protein
VKHQKVTAETIHGFLGKNKISMSVVMGQRTWVSDKEVSNTVNGVDASTEGLNISTGSIQSTTSDGQKVYDVSFGEKNTYKLEAEGGEKTYDALTRTVEVNYYAKSPLLHLQNLLLFFSNTLAARMFPTKYVEVSKVWMNATKANYLYITSYPTYDGYQVTHDPVYTAYIPPVKTTNSGGVPVPDVAVFIGLGAVVLFLMKRRV